MVSGWATIFILARVMDEVIITLQLPNTRIMRLGHNLDLAQNQTEIKVKNGL